MNENNTYTYYADIGCIRLSNKDGSAVMVPNGYGDGAFNLYIVDKLTVNTYGYKLRGYIEGTFNVCEYDTSNDSVLVQLIGKYAVYSHSGDILLEKWR